jgi:8-oxo-dGTP diphosphatase
MRRYGEPPVAGRRYQTRLGAFGIIREGDAVLVTEKTGPERAFQLPGGALDASEGAIRALHRECLEETGWRIRAERRLGAYQRFTFMKGKSIWARKVCQIYLCRPVLKLGPPLDARHRAFWMPIPVALELIGIEGDRAFLARLEGGV